MADKEPSDVPPIPIPPIVDLTGAGAEPDDKTTVRPRKKAEPKAVPPAVAPAASVAPVEPAPAGAPAPPAPPIPPAPPVADAQPNPYAAAPAAPANPYAAAPAQPNPYAAAPAQPNPYAAAPAQPNPYAAPGAPQPYAYGPYVPQPAKGLSITSMILGIAGIVLSLCWGFGVLLGIGAVITGFVAAKSQPHAKGMWMTGIITGFVAIGVGLLSVVALFAIGLVGSGSSYYNY